MKRCNACSEEFADKFSFCPVDGTAFSGMTPGQRVHEFKLTMVGERGLIQRLAIELEFLLDQARESWPSFKRNPIAFTGKQLSELKQVLKSTLARPHVLSGSLTALLLVTAIILSVLLFERHSTVTEIAEGDDFSQTVEIDLRNEEKPRTDSGVGADEKGRVGFERGSGEGSRPVPAKARGGGGGGMNNPSAPSQGRLPQPSEVPAPISTTLARLPPQALPAAGIDIDPELWRKLSFSSYGDPRSKSNTPSNGSGNGGGVGTNNGTGIGEGNGPGFGPGRDGNMGGDSKSIGGGRKGGGSGDNPNPDDPDRVYSSPQVTTRARVISKPEPQYTEEARRAQITGTVILRVVFSRTGQVTNIHAMQSLSGGLTEKAIAAARQIRFVPATRNGQAVSMYMQLEYNFNLY